MKSECQICFSTVRIQRTRLLSCECFICFVCLAKWTETKIKEKRLDADSNIPCPSCKKNIQIQEIFTKVGQIQKIIINEALLQVYLTEANDIRKCPTSNCHYAGIIRTNLCKKETQCPVCLTTWKEALNYATFDRIFSVLHINHVINNFLSTIRKRVWSKKCPSCKALIEKNGGCDHMTCSKCSHQFHWECSCPYSNHSPLRHIFVKILKPIFQTLLVFLLLLSAAYLLYLVPPIKFVADWTIIPSFNFFKIIFYGIWSLVKSVIPWDWSYLPAFAFCNIKIFCTARIILDKRLNFKEKVFYGAAALLCLVFSYYFNLLWTILTLGVIESGLLVFINIRKRLKLRRAIRIRFERQLS